MGKTIFRIVRNHFCVECGAERVPVVIGAAMEACADCLKSALDLMRGGPEWRPANEVTIKVTGEFPLDDE